MDELRAARLQREWALCALAAAASRFVPVPLVDDVIAERATRTAVVRTWRAHGRPDAPDAIDVLCADTRGFWGGLAASAARLPVTLALYPIRKPVRMVMAVRGVGRDLAEVLLLARSVDRCLRAGWFDTTDQGELRRQAALVRRAHEETVATADLRILEHALRAGLRQVGGLRRQAVVFARHSFGRDAPDPLQQPATDADAGIEQGAAQVQAALDRPDVEGLLARLDRRFDTALGALTPASG